MMTGLPALAQPNYDYTQLSTEQLDRGVVAVRQADGRVFVSWRSLMSDPKGMAFDVYRNGEKLNQQPLTKGGTWFIDENPVENAVYKVESGTRKEESDLASTFRLQTSVGYLTIPLQKPDNMHTANDATVNMKLY